MSLPSRLFLAVLLTSGLGCFQPRYLDCNLTCTESAQCPAPMSCQEGYCVSRGSPVSCHALDGGQTEAGSRMADVLTVEDASRDRSADATHDSLPDGPEDAPGDSRARTDGPADSGEPMADAARARSQSGTDAGTPDGGPNDAAAVTPASMVVSMSPDTADSLLVDRVANRDDNAGPGDGSDGVFDVGVTGPFDALLLITVADAQGTSLGVASQTWDTLAAGQPVPQAVANAYSQVTNGPLLGVSVNGASLVNGADGSLPPFGPGDHQIQIFANGSSGAFHSGQYFRLGVLRGDSLFWGLPIAFSWGRPAIERMSLDAHSGLVDRVGEGDAALDGGGYDDGAFDLEVDGPLDALILLVDVPGNPEGAWDTIVGSAPFPQNVSSSSYYTRGSDTWVLGVAGASGTLLNRADGTLPRINGRQSLTLYATDISLSIFSPGSSEPLMVQAVGMIGDLTVWGPRLAVP